MIPSDFYFEDTVVDFYQNSNEVEVFTHEFICNILPEIDNRTVLSWLDVGIGNGEKIAKIIPYISNEINLTFLEPSNSWVNELILTGNLDVIKGKTTAVGHYKTFEEFMNQKENCFDLISFIHVLYNKKIVDSLFSFIDNKMNITNFSLLINVETENNDLSKIRKKLNDSKWYSPISQLPYIKEQLRKRHIKYVEYVSEGKILDVNIEDVINNENHWIYPLILGVSKKEYATKIKNTNIINAIKEELSKIKNINIEDVTLFSKSINHE
ncbi:MAG: hypothetical protein LBL79_03200 [Prevotella sp.]|jgi:hypothetical protein|nr:hypothetical protein [Prevotella sp.]